MPLPARLNMHCTKTVTGSFLVGYFFIKLSLVAMFVTFGPGSTRLKMKGVNAALTRVRFITSYNSPSGVFPTYDQKSQKLIIVVILVIVETFDLVIVGNSPTFLSITVSF